MPKYGYIYAYEVDGLGHASDRLIQRSKPALCAVYRLYVANDRYYENTRHFLLSADNPSFYQGQVARGIGSFHTPDHWIWPLALIMEGLTAIILTAKSRHVLTQSLASDPGDHLLHESFDPDDRKRFTREDFGWPNALFSEFVMTQLQGAKEISMGDTSDLEFRSE